LQSKTSSSNILDGGLELSSCHLDLLLAVKVTKNCLDGLDLSLSWDEMFVLLAINLPGHCRVLSPLPLYLAQLIKVHLN